MDGFEPARNQDASATFRGFVYQVDLTLLRWLCLREGDYLELERGEDIDSIARAVAESGDEEFVRTLEQVKVRKTKLSLRAAEALTSLANAYAHRQANPGLNLRFCYSTNADITRERPNPFPGGNAGIELWEQVRQQLINDDQQREAVTAIRDFLAQAIRPSAVSEEDWSGFVGLMSNAEQRDVSRFIRRFEWSCGVDAPGSLTGKVKRRLTALVADYESSCLRIDELYGRLFLYVLKLLTQSGPKQLTRELLSEQVSMPTLSATDRNLLSRLGGRLELVELRVEQVERTIESVSATVRSLAQEFGSGFGPVRVESLVSVGQPPLVERFCPREDTVAGLLTSHDSICWLAIFGTTDTGKTHLASLLASCRPRRDWFRFRHDMPPSQALAVFRETAFRIVQDSPDDTAAIPYQALCHAVETGAVLLLDDLPQLQNDDVLTEELARLARCCAGEQVSIISSSRFRLPSRLTDFLGENQLRETAAPPFSDPEAATLFLAFGAPEDFDTGNRVTLINTLADGHPFLLTQAARYLQRRHWRFEKDDLTALLRGDHTSGVTDELLARLCVTLTESQRDLLYRLSLATRSVSPRVVSELAEVTPTIERYQECLADLVGAWLQRDDAKKYAVSPIATHVLGGSLQGAVKEQCHVILGTGIAQEVMDPWDAHAAIDHYRAGKAYDLAGILFIELLKQSRLREQVAACRPLFKAWSESPLPKEMHARIKLMVRAMQFWTYPRYAIPDDYVLTELDTLMSKLCPELAVPGFHVASLAILFLSQRDFGRSHKYFSQAIAAMRKSDTDRNDLMIPSKENPVELLWSSITNIQSRDHLECWMGAFEALSEDEQQVVMNSNHAPLGSMVLADRMILVESERPQKERLWSTVLDALHRLFDWARAIGWEHLAACAMKSETNVCGEFLHEARPNLDRVNQFVENATYTESAKALVAGMYGKMIVSNGDHKEAIAWLERAISAPPPCEGHDRLMTLLAAATCCRDDSERARGYTEQAVQLVERTDSISQSERTKARIEHAIAEIGQTHTRENALRCFPVWDAAACSMFASPKRDDAWKDLFVLFGHTQSFFFQLATNGEAPTHACDGSPYAPPYQGFTATTHPDRLKLFHAESIPGVMWFQSLYARAAGHSESADAWLQRAVDEIESLPATHVTATVRQEMLPQLLESNQFADAFHAGILGTQASVALREFVSSQTTRQAVSHATPLEQLVDRLTDEGKQLAERFALITAAIPALLRLATIAIKDLDRSRDTARQLTGFCRQMSHGAAEPKLWNGAANVYEAVALGKDAKGLFELAHSFDQATDRELRVMGYLAVSVSGAVEEAYCAQLASIEVLISWYPTDSATYAKIVLPFIEQYWLESFRRERFRFRSPSLVELDLRQAVELAPPQRVPAILRAVRPAFRVRGLSNAEAWLNAQEGHRPGQ